MGKGSKPHRSAKRSKPLRPQTGAPSSLAGRPRLDRERYANGRLKPVGPNDRIVQERRALLGKPEAKGLALKAAENPLDLAHARGWLSKEFLEAAETFRTLHARSGLSAPRMKVSNPEPTVRVHAGAAADPVALYYLARIWEGLRHYADAKSELVDVCLLQLWPAWLTDLVFGKDPANMDPKRHALRCGLAVVIAVTSKPPPAVIDRGSDLSLFVDDQRRSARYG